MNNKIEKKIIITYKYDEDGDPIFEKWMYEQQYNRKQKLKKLKKDDKQTGFQILNIPEDLTTNKLLIIAYNESERLKIIRKQKLKNLEK